MYDKNRLPFFISSFFSSLYYIQPNTFSFYLWSRLLHSFALHKVTHSGLAHCTVAEYSPSSLLKGLLRSHLSHGRLCKHYVTSSRPTEKPHTDLVNNNNAPLIPLPPIMHPPPIIHPSSNGSNDFVLLSNEQRTMPSSSLTRVPDNAYYTPNDTPSRTPSSTLTHHFDTFALVERLETEGGFTRSQARFLMEIMQEQIRAR